MEFTIAETRQLIALVKNKQNTADLGSNNFLFLDDLNKKLETGLKEILGK